MIKQTRNIYIVKMVGKQNKTSSDPTPHEESSLQKVTKFDQPANLRLGMQKKLWQQSRNIVGVEILKHRPHLSLFLRQQPMSHFGCT